MHIKIGSLLSFFLVWVGINGLHFEPSLLLFLAIVPIITYWFGKKLSLIPARNSFNLRSFSYALWLMKEIFNSSIAVIKISWRKNLMIKPVIEPIKSIQESKTGIVTYANSITLTPGTVTLSTENNILLVHALDVSFMEDLKEGVMDKKVKQIIK